MGVSAAQPRPEPQTTPGQSTAILPLSLNAVSYEAGGQRLINNITFALHAGPRTVVMGPNGAGKPLLLRLCHGLIAPTAGSVQWQGQADPETGGSYAVKRYESEKHVVDGELQGFRVTLVPSNSEFDPIELTPEFEDEVSIIAGLVDVLVPPAD